MKKILQLGLVCAGIAIIAAASSCGKDYNAYAYPGQDTTKNTFRGTFTAVVDGVAFSADNKAVYDKTQDNIRTLSVSGVMDSYNKDPKSNQSIAFTITDYKGPGTYPIAQGTAGVYINKTDNVAKTYLALAGDTTAVIVITNDNGTVDGTLNFEVAPNGIGTSDKHSIFNGVFSIPK